MNNNPNNYKFDPFTGEPINNNSNPVNNNVELNNVQPVQLGSNPFQPEPVQPVLAPVEPVTPVVTPVEPVAPVVEQPVAAPVEPVTPVVEQPVVQPTQPSFNQQSVQNTGLNQNQPNGNQGYVPPIGPSMPAGYVPSVQPAQNKPIYGISNNPQYSNKKKKGKAGVVFFYIFILAIIGAAVAAFLIPKGKTANNEPKYVSRTIMIYMVGSNLESDAGFGSEELRAIDYDVMDHENINVVLIAGGSKKWYNNYVDISETSIFELTADGFKKVKQQSKRNMGSEEVLADFLSYVYDNYKTDRYDLIFWDHGGAIMGANQDELYNNDFLTLEEFQGAMKRSPFNPDNKIEVIAFSTCLNGTIEVADTFKDYAQYLVASEEETQSVVGGSDFEFINSIQNTDKAYDFAYKFVDGYKKKMNSYKKRASYNDKKSYSTYSVVNLENVDKLVDAVNDFFADVDASEYYNEISRVRANIYQYPEESTEFDMVDLYNLVDGLKEISPEKAQKVLDTFEETVAYNWATNSQSRGLSIYFPYKSHRNYISMYKSIYNKLTNFTKYSKFIEKYDTIRSSGGTTSKSYQDNKTTVSYKNNEADFTLELTKDQLETFASAKYMVFRDNKDGTYKPFYLNGSASLDGNKVNAKIRGKQLMITFDKDEDGLDSYPLILNELDDDEKYTRYTTAVILEDFRNDDWKMDRANITLIYDKKTGKIEVADVIAASDDELTPSRISLVLDDYQYVAFSASSSYYIDEDGFTSNGVITGYEIGVNEFEYELENFDDGYDYYCVFVIEDTYGNTSLSKLVKMN